MMRVEIRLEHPESYVRLLHGFLATSDSFSHDRNLITFFNDDGMSLHLNTNVNYVSFGLASAAEDDRRWAANVDVGTVQQLLIDFMRREYGRLEALD